MCEVHVDTYMRCTWVCMQDAFGYVCGGAGGAGLRKCIYVKAMWYVCGDA